MVLCKQQSPWSSTGTFLPSCSLVWLRLKCLVKNAVVLRGARYGKLGQEAAVRIPPGQRFTPSASASPSVS